MDASRRQSLAAMLAGASGLLVSEAVAQTRSGGLGVPASRITSGALPQLNAKTDFGAVGNGVADDTIPLTNFINSTAGINKYIPPGLYRITAVLPNVPAYNYVYGSNTPLIYYGGTAGVSQPQTAIVADNITGGFSTGNAVIALTNQTTEIDRIAVIGVSAVTDGFVMGSGGILRNCLAGNCRTGFVPNGSTSILLNCEASFNSASGISCSGSDLSIINSRFHNNTQHGCYLSGAVKCLLYGNTFEWNTQQGLWLDGAFATASDIAVVCNTFDRNTGNGLIVRGPINTVTIVGNTFRRNGVSATGASAAHIQYLAAITDMQQFGNAYLAQHVNDDGSGIIAPNYIYSQGSSPTFSSCQVIENTPIQNVGVFADATTQALIQPTSARNIATGSALASVAASAYTAQTPVVTEFYYAEIFIPANCLVTGVGVFNSGTISGNMKVGLADNKGNILATSTSTAMAGTSQYQRVAFTTPFNAQGPTTAFILLFYDNTTVRPNTYTQGNFAAGKITGQVYATGFTNFSPASTFTTALGPVASLY